MKRAYVFSTWMQATFTDGQWFKIYQHIDFYGRIQRTSSLKKDKREYLLEVDVEHPMELHENHNMLPFLAEGMKIGKGRGGISTKFQG